MNEIEALRWQTERYRGQLNQNVDRLHNALEELSRTTLLLLGLPYDDADIDAWLQAEGFALDDDGFYQSRPTVEAFRAGTSAVDAMSVFWPARRAHDPVARHHLFAHRALGPHIRSVHQRLGDAGWIYYQDSCFVSLQYPFIDQRTAISADFDWSQYHTFRSVCPDQNPEREIRWTPPSVDYAGEGIILSASIPVWRDDDFIGLWSIDVPIRYLSRDFATSSLPRQTQFICDRNGMLLSHDRLQAEIDQSQGRLVLHSLKELGGEWRNLDIRTELMPREDGEVWIEHEDDESWVYCFCLVAGVDWLVFTGIPKVVMEEAAAVRLKEAFRRVSDGNFRYRIESSPDMALPTLVEEFNKMSERLALAEERRQRAEEQLREAQKMEAIGRLAGGVAHDYNNMLGVIMGNAELAMTEMEAGDPGRHEFEEIYAAAERSRDLTRQLLVFARRQTIRPKVLDMNAMIEDLLKMLKPIIGEDIALDWQPDPDLWPTLMDPSQLGQLIANLFVNARDAISGVGNITVATSNVIVDDDLAAMLDEPHQGPYVSLSLSDDGMGIDPEVLPNVFEPFFTTKGVGQGTGLGLATVYGIVRQNNGFVQVQSELGKGTSFEVFLPRAAGPVDDLAAKEVPPPTLGQRQRVLVVEDEDVMLRYLQRTLEGANYDVQVTPSPREAVEMARTALEPFEVLITDVVMPELNGPDLAAKLKELSPELKVIYMSGYMPDEVVQRGALEDDAILLHKPFSSHEIIAKLHEVLQSHPR